MARLMAGLSAIRQNQVSFMHGVADVSMPKPLRHNGVDGGGGYGGRAG